MRGLHSPILIWTLLAMTAAPILLLWSPPAQGQVNDLCADAIPVGNGNFFYNTNSADTNLDQPCSDDEEGDVHYLFTPTCSGLLRVTTCSSNDDTVVTVWDTADCSDAVPGNELGCSDDDDCATLGPASRVIAPVAVGQQYLITVSGKEGSSASGFLEIACTVNGQTDECADAVTLANGTTTINNIFTTLDGPVECAGMDNDVWFRYTATDESLVVQVSQLNWNVAIYDGSVSCPPSAGSSLTCGLAEAITPVIPGNEYLIQVGGPEAIGEITIGMFAPPANNACVDATPVGNGTFVFDNVAATLDGPLDCGGSSVERDIWFNFTAPCTGTVLVASTMSVPSVMAFYPASVGCIPPSGSYYACNAQFIVADVMAGSSYLVRVVTIDEGVGEISFDCVESAMNDACADALPVGNGVFPFHTLGATTDLDQPCAPNERDLHYLYTASSSGTLYVSTCIAPGPYSTDTVLTVWNTNDCALAMSGNELGCNDDGCGPGSQLSSQVAVPVAQGSEYLITVAGFAGSIVQGQLSIQSDGVSVNDDCDSAVVVSDGMTGFNNLDASNGGPMDCAGGSNDVWFTYTAACDGNGFFAVSGDVLFDVAIYEASAGCPPLPGSSLACGSGQAVAAIDAGTSYFIQVGSVDGGIGILDIACKVPPANDLCQNVEILDVGETVVGTTTGATIDADAQTCGIPFTSPGVWYSVIGTGTELLATTCGPFFGYDTRISVYCGDCTIPLCLGDNDDDCSNANGVSSLASTVSFCTQAGAEYWILVHGSNGEEGDFGLTVEETGLACTPSIQCLPTGACCLPSTDCQGGLSLAECEALGGTYLGDGTACEGDFIQYVGEMCANPFEDISSTGVQSTATDCGVCEEIVPLGFDFEFSGDMKTTVNITQYGVLTFGDPVLFFFTIPAPMPPNDLIAPLFDFWSPGSVGAVYYQALGVSPNQRFIVQWNEMAYSGATSTTTFQVVLFEGSNSIGFRYLDIWDGAMPVVGIEDATGTVGFDVGAVSSGDCVLLTPVLGRPDACGPAEPEFLRADADGNGVFNGLIDAIFSLSFQFQGGPAPICLEAADADGDGTFNGLIDALYSLTHQFQGGPAPGAPYPDCGEDPDPAGSLGCNPNGC